MHPQGSVRLQITIRFVLSFLFLLLGVGYSPFVGAGGGPMIAGQLLVATPEMNDPRFAQSVIYIVRHDKEGAMGLVVNKPVARGSISELLKAVGEEVEGGDLEVILHYGGPVESGKGFVLHTDDYTEDGTEVVCGGMALTADVGILRDIARGRGPQNRLIMLGYAGWAPGQLEGELLAGAWFIIPAEKELIFDDHPETIWERARDRRKVEL